MNNYTIIHVSDRALQNMLRIRSILNSWTELDDNQAVHGLKTNAFNVLRSLGFKFDYRPDDGRIDPMMPTEAGVFASHILAMKNALEHGCNTFAIFEDDAILSDDFCSVYDNAIAALPNDWDFLSFIAIPEMNIFSEESDIGSNVIHKCLTQPSYLACVLYSNQGIRKFINYIHENSIYYNIDSMLYRASHRGSLNGYILRNEFSYAVRHDPLLIISDIDPCDKRKTL